MSYVFLVRAFAYLGLPLLLAAVVIGLDARANSRERRLEVVLIYLFAFTAASGIAGAMGHFFAADQVAEAIGWPTGSPFQTEMGFANLAVGILAAIAVARRDGFREATVLGGAVLSVGAFIVHMIDLAHTGNLAPGNILINITNLGRPALLIYFIAALRRAELAPGSEKESHDFSRWRTPHAALGGACGAGVGIGLGIGLMIGRPVLGLAAGLAAGLALGLLQRKKAAAAP